MPAILRSEARRAPSAPTAESSLALRMGEFAAALRFDDVPSAVVLQAKRCLVDAVGNAFASGAYDFSRCTLSALVTERANGPYPVIGFAQRLASNRDAALVNGVLIHGLDYDDTHVPGVVHVSASALPTALAVAIERRLTGREFLTGYVLAMEATARLASVAEGGFHQVGFHPTGVVGAFGAAVAAAALSGLSPNAIANAQGIAGSMAAGSLEFLETGSWTKRLHPGHAAACGLLAARLASQGFTGPRSIYEGRFGLYRTHLGEKLAADPSWVLDDLGERWEVRRVAIKPYPSCHFTHSFIDAALSLLRQGLEPSEIADVECLIAPGEVGTVCIPAEAKQAPKNEYAAKFSLQYVVAAALVRGRFGLEELLDGSLFDKEILDLAQRVSYRDDPTSGFPRHYSGEVIVTTRDGRTLRAREQINRGAEERPLDDTTVEQKFVDNMCLTRSRSVATRIGETLQAIERVPDMAAVGEVLRG
jgi:2-methylcitrate dehydratase PrpD